MAQPVTSTVSRQPLSQSNRIKRNIHDLPSEVFSEIISYLPFRDIPLLLRVCKDWNHKIMNSKYVLKHMQNAYPNEIQKQKKLVLTKLDASENTLRNSTLPEAREIAQTLSEVTQLKSKFQSIETETTPLNSINDIFQNYRDVDLELGEVYWITKKTNCVSYLCTRRKVVVFVCGVTCLAVIAGVVGLILGPNR